MPAGGSTGATITSGQGTTSITVNFGSSYAGGVICVKANGVCGSSDYSCKPANVPGGKPTSPVTINGPASICKGNNATYSIAAVMFANSYTWVASGGIIITSGQGTTTITVSTPSTFSNGSVKVYATNCRGNSSTRSKGIKGISIPAQPCSINGNSTVCQGSNIYLYETCHGSAVSSWTWTITPIGSATITNQGTKKISVSWLTAGTKTISVTATNACGTSVPRTKTVTVNTCREEEQPGTINSVVIYPNPANDLLNVTFSSADQSSFTIEIVDVIGRTVFNTIKTAAEGFNTETIDISTLSKGIYTLVFRTKESEQQVRLMVD